MLQLDAIILSYANGLLNDSQPMWVVFFHRASNANPKQPKVLCHLIQWEPPNQMPQQDEDIQYRGFFSLFVCQLLLLLLLSVAAF